MKDYAIAMAAAHTFLVANPEDEVMQKNMQYYKQMPQAKPEYFKDMEVKEHQVNSNNKLFIYLSSEMQLGLTIYVIIRI